MESWSCSNSLVAPNRTVGIHVPQVSPNVPTGDGNHYGFTGTTLAYRIASFTPKHPTWKHQKYTCSPNETQRNWVRLPGTRGIIFVPSPYEFHPETMTCSLPMHFSMISGSCVTCLGCHEVASYPEDVLPRTQEECWGASRTAGSRWSTGMGSILVTQKWGGWAGPSGAVDPCRSMKWVGHQVILPANGYWPAFSWTLDDFRGSKFEASLLLALSVDAWPQSWTMAMTQLQM